MFTEITAPLILSLFVLLILLRKRNRANRDFTARKRPEIASRKGIGKRKPDWVPIKVLYLKTHNPGLGCRKIAELFNNSYGTLTDESISKTYVAYTLCNEAYELYKLKMARHHHAPFRYIRNALWNIDFCTVTLLSGQKRKIFAVVDAGTRELLLFSPIQTTNTTNVIFQLLKLFLISGIPKAIGSDNDGVFRARLFRSTIGNLLKHQRITPGHPWQNGRIERLIGTFRGYCADFVPADDNNLQLLAVDFYHWYNSYRPHQALGGRTPIS